VGIRDLGSNTISPAVLCIFDPSGIRDAHGESASSDSSMKLLILTACDKVLVDALGGGQSLIGIFEGVNVVLTDAYPSNASLQREWFIFSKWQLEPDEEGKNYTSLTEIFWPDGNKFGGLELVAAPPTKSGMSFIGRLLTFPFGQIGNLKVVQTLRSDGDLVFGPFEMSISVQSTIAQTSTAGEANAKATENP
jgi:hypothetical protein